MPISLYRYQYLYSNIVTGGGMMKSQATVLLKILLLSSLIALLIRYVVPGLNVPATSTVALGLVLTPTLVMGLLLGWRSRQVGAKAE